ADIINDVLDFSKLESGKMVLRPQVFNLHALAHEIMDMFRADAERRRLSLQLDLHHDLPPHVVGDAQRIRQIILNLISNALKFTPRGSVTLRLLPLLQQKNGAHDEVIVRFIVHDTGIGISPSDQTKLFSEYHQLGETYRGKTEGTGLGLAICRQLVHLMKGEIGLESRVGEGTKFWFVLPMQVVSQARAHAVHNIASTEPVPRTILLVEDTETNLLIAQSMLQKMGQRLVVARDGLEAVEKAKTHDIDMVLMDVMMPRMDGMTATQHLRAEGYDGPIIAMTALVTPEDRDKCLAAGMNDFISKPLKMADLKTCLIQHQAQTML
ncbi:MAG: response regulator, partial [Alphaproteobacteria bacterium]|nr:response regulator [Alphaproteobacteria bacterium]